MRYTNPRLLYLLLTCLVARWIVWWTSGWDRNNFTLTNIVVLSPTVSARDWRWSLTWTA